MNDTRREGLVEAIERAANDRERWGQRVALGGFNPTEMDDAAAAREDARLLREHAADLEALRDFFAEVWPYALSEPEKEALARIASRLTNGGERDDG